MFSCEMRRKWRCHARVSANNYKLQHCSVLKEVVMRFSFSQLFIYRIYTYHNSTIAIVQLWYHTAHPFAIKHIWLGEGKSPDFFKTEELPGVISRWDAWMASPFPSHVTTEHSALNKYNFTSTNLQKESEYWNQFSPALQQSPSSHSVITLIVSYPKGQHITSGGEDNHSEDNHNENNHSEHTTRVNLRSLPHMQR